MTQSKIKKAQSAVSSARLKLESQEDSVDLVTHEPDIAEYAKRIITVRDGLILSDEIKEQ